MLVDKAADTGRFRTAIICRDHRTAINVPVERSVNVQPGGFMSANVQSACILLAKGRIAMAARVRLCAVCPKCGMRYLIGFSPYRNGSYLIPAARGMPEEW